MNVDHEILSQFEEENLYDPFWLFLGDLPKIFQIGSVMVSIGEEIYIFFLRD